MACVVCAPVDDGHRYLPAPSARDVLEAALRRSDVELAATEAFLVMLEQTDDLVTLQAALGEALRRVDAMAGRDRSREIDLFRHRAARCAGSEEALARSEARFAQLEREHEAANARLSAAVRAEQIAATRKPRWWRRERGGQEVAVGSNEAARQLQVVTDALRDAEAVVATNRRDQDEALRAAIDLREAEATQATRTAWLEAHPEVVHYLASLAERVVEGQGRRHGVGGPEPVRGVAAAAGMWRVAPPSPDYNTVPSRQGSAPELPDL